MKRGMSSIISLLGIGSKQSDEDAAMLPPDHQSLSISRSGLRAGFTHANDSNATTVVNPLRLRLTGEETPEPVTPHSASLSPCYEKELGDEFARVLPNSLSIRRSRGDLRRSQSTPGLHCRISQRLSQAFSSPTTIKRPELKARPSAQTLHSTLPNGPGAQFSGIQLSSSPSANNSWSTSSPQDAQKSTPPTSDGATLSPASVFHHEGIALVDNDRAVHFAHTLTDQPRLTPIPEGAVLPGLSIKTVEATATAKIFFETHFNWILHGADTYEIRRHYLETMLREHQIPVNLHCHISKEWEHNQSDTLRLTRVFKTFEVGRRRARALAIGKYEVVKVLGKGSFGVVRLVKEKLLPRSSGRIASTAEMIRHVSQTLKSPSKDIATSFLSRKGDLSKLRKEVFAMKVIRKSDMLRNSQEGHLRAERDFLVASEGSKWIIPLIEAFQDTKFLYLIMDFCIGGDFLGLLIRKNTLSEEITKWYVAEMILCVEEAHRMRWIHRDVKPDNFLIGADGHLKISDFGLAFDGEWDHDQRFYHKQRHDLLNKLGIKLEGDAQDQQEQQDVENSRRVAQNFSQSTKSSKQLASKDEPPPDEPILDWRNRAQRRRLARSVVGTSQYMAPEVIRGDLYDGRCDWWSVGVIMYECLYGYTPFACEDRHNTKLKILKHKHTLRFPECEPAREPSRSALDLMQSLLVEKEKRICSRQYELNDFTKRLVGGQSVRFTADKANKNYSGLFVYADDAQDLKTHPYFRNIR
jgi:serine/threonine protein kinase